MAKSKRSVSPPADPPANTSNPDENEPGEWQPPNVIIRYHDLPPGFREDRWSQVSWMRAAFATADRYVNAVTYRGGRSTGLVLSDELCRDLIQWLGLHPPKAVERMHEEARNLAGNLRRDYPRMSIPQCPEFPAVLEGGNWNNARAQMAIRDTVESLHRWIDAVADTIQEWSRQHLQPQPMPPPQTAHADRPRQRRRRVQWSTGEMGVLEELYSKEAFSQSDAVPTAKLASLVNNTLDTVRSFLDSLKKQKLVKTKAGRSGGCYLTEKGLRAWREHLEAAS